MKSPRVPALRIALLSLVALGCSPDPVPLCDAEAAGDCLVDQHGCQLVEGEPTCVACAPGSRADASGACATIPGAPMAHTFPDVESAPGEEIIGLCRSWTLGNETELWVHAVELEQREASHHSNWMFVPDDTYVGPDGVWPCEERDYRQLNAALAGGVLCAQSTRAEREVQLFPEGAAIRLPPRARIISTGARRARAWSASCSRRWRARSRAPSIGSRTRSRP